MLHFLLKHYVRKGTLTVHYPGGVSCVYGSDTPQVTMRITDRRALWTIGLDHDLKLGEMYMEGRLVIEQGDIRQLLGLLMSNIARSGGATGGHYGLRQLRWALRAFTQFNPVTRARAHVAHHYDLSRRLYDLFLDVSRQYSCAYFTHDDASLEEAQAAKKAHIAAKLKLDRPGLKVLDIGCGWGGLAMDLARIHQAEVLGITLSTEQIAVAQELARQNGLAPHCQFALTDYRQQQGTFDRLVSVGMFEHVGARYYDAYFAKARELLADDGVMLLHTIGRTDGP